MSEKSVSPWLIGVAAAFVIGNITGFMLGLGASSSASDFLEEMLTDEQPANVSAPTEVTRPAFEFRHPSNWKIDTKDEDYDPDHFFSVESPGSAHISIFVFDVATDPDVNISAQREQFAKLMTFEEDHPLNMWGAHRGSGRRFAGRMLGMKASLRVFSTSGDERSFIVVEQFFEEDRKKVEPGFALIESSFKLK